MFAHHKGTTFHQQFATTPALSSATCVPARSYRTFEIVHFARPKARKKRSEKPNTSSTNVNLRISKSPVPQCPLYCSFITLSTVQLTAIHVQGAKHSETTIKNAVWMLGCWCMLQQCWVKQQAPKLLSYLRSSSWPIRQLQALRPQKTWAESRGIHICCSRSAQNSKDRNRYVLTFWWHTQCINMKFSCTFLFTEAVGCWFLNQQLFQATIRRWSPSSP